MDMQLFWIPNKISASHISQLPTDMQTLPQETHWSQFISLCSIFRLLCKIAKSDYCLCHICSYIRMEQLGSHWMDFMKFDIWIFFEQCLLEWGMCQHCTKNENTHFTFKNFFFWKSCHWWDNVERYDRAGQAADDNMVHAQGMLHN